jgi:hypothetical protein
MFPERVHDTDTRRQIRSGIGQVTVKQDNFIGECHDSGRLYFAGFLRGNLVNLGRLFIQLPKNRDHELMGSATHQLPMYAENAVPVINESNKAVFIKTLNSRLDEIEKERKRKRVEKVIKKLFASRIV